MFLLIPVFDIKHIFVHSLIALTHDSDGLLYMFASLYIKKIVEINEIKWQNLQSNAVSSVLK